MLTFANSTVDHENWYSFISMKFDVEKKWIILKNFVDGGENLCGYINISTFFWVRHSALAAKEN